MSAKNIKVSILKFLKARKLTCEPQAVEDHMVRIHVRTLRLTQVPRKISGMWIVSPFKSASENAFWCQAWMILQAANIQHDLANPATKRETLRPWWCCSSHFGIALPSLARAEQQRRQQRKQAALALKRLEAAAEKQVQEQLCASKKKRHVTPHLDLHKAEKRNQKRAQTKRELRKWRKEKCYSFKAGQNKAEMQKCFDRFGQDVEAWRAQKQKDNARQQKCRAKKSLRRKTLKKLLEVRHAVQIWPWQPQCLQHLSLILHVQVVSLRLFRRRLEARENRTVFDRRCLRCSFHFVVASDPSAQFAVSLGFDWFISGSGAVKTSSHGRCRSLESLVG